MVSPIPKGILIWENLGRSGVLWSYKYPNPRGGSGLYFMLTGPQNWGDGKILWAVGIYYGWPEELTGLQGSLYASIQALPDTQKATDAAHRHGVSANHVHETDSQTMTVDAIQAIANETKEYKKSMENLRIINLTLSETLTQAQEAILVLSKQLQTL